MGGSRFRRAAVTAGALGVVSVAVAVWLIRSYGWGSASAVVTVAALPTVVVGLYLALAGRYGTPTGDELTLETVADLLAVAVRQQWIAEAVKRSLTDPYPLPVRWQPADPDLMEDWASLERRATTGTGWPPPPRAGTWATGPAGLAGGGELAEVLGRVPTGRLVVLGEPGSGKTRACSGPRVGHGNHVN
jgi:hypothetical protein